MYCADWNGLSFQLTLAMAMIDAATERASVVWRVYSRPGIHSSRLTHNVWTVYLANPTYGIHGLVLLQITLSLSCRVSGISTLISF